jgi:hypothetical protein
MQWTIRSKNGVGLVIDSLQGCQDPRNQQCVTRDVRVVSWIFLDVRCVAKKQGTRQRRDPDGDALGVVSSTHTQYRVLL